MHKIPSPKSSSFPPKCNPLCKKKIPYQTKSFGLFRLKKPPQIVDTMPIATPQGTLDFKSVDKVTFVGASSNTVIDTTTGSLGVGVGVGGPTSNLHVVGNTRLEGDINMLHTSNTASIKLNSNVVTEFPRSKKLIKYPRLLLTYAAQSSQGGYENYIVNQSSVYSSESSHGAYLAFRGNSHWLSSSNSFDGAPDRFNDVNGPWISIQLPTKIKLEYLEFYAASGRLAQLITSGSVYASNNGSTWINIGSLDNLGTYTNFVPAHVDFTHTTLYDRYLLHITANATNYVHMEKLSLFGTPEYDPEAHGTDVTVKSYPNVPNTDWLEVYYDAKNYTSGAVQDETSNNRDATLDGVVHDPVSKSFTFDGGNDKIHMGPFSNFTPTSSYTVSLWFKVPEISSGEDILFHFGHGTGGESFGMNVDNGKLGVFIWNGTSVKTQADIFTATKWVHTTCIANSDGTVEIYFNGRLVLSGDTGQALTIPTNPYLSLGIHFSGEQTSFQSAGFFKGSIANFRLFNRALTSDEIYQLYAYQKEYFGLGDLSMTLKAGRLGIGTSEPRVALDVRGDIMGGCPVVVDAVAESATAANNLVNWNLIAMNKGNGLVGTTFTAPYAGHYFCHMHGMGEWIYTSAEVRLIVLWYKNGSFYGTVGGNSNDAKMYNAYDSQYNHSNHMTIGGSIIPYLEVGETIQTSVSGSSNADFHGRYNRLTIHYIG